MYTWNGRDGESAVFLSAAASSCSETLATASTTSSRGEVTGGCVLFSEVETSASWRAMTEKGREEDRRANLQWRCRRV